MSTLNLRAARPNDAQALARAHYASLQTLEDLLPLEYMRSKTEQGLIELWTHELKASIRKTFVAENVNNKICGFVSCGPSTDKDLADRPAGEILRLYLTPDYIGHGAGSVLLEHAIGVMQNRGFEPIMLWVFEANTRARKFYIENGFEEDIAAMQAEAGLRMLRYFWTQRRKK